MATFTYKSRDSQGGLRQGTVEAVSQQAAVDVLREHNLIVTAITETSGGAAPEALGGLFKRVPTKEKVIFARQLSTMINSGLPIVQALNILAEQTPNKNFKTIIGNVAGDVEGGLSFSESIAKYQRVFSQIFVNLVKSGEASGKLDEVLDRLATQMEKDYAVVREIKGAMYYPAFILVAIFVVAAVMMVFVIPQLKSLFDESNVKLPFVTQMLIAISGIVQSFWWLILILMVGGIWSFFYFIRTPTGRPLWDQTKLKIPVLGNLSRKIYVARFARTLGTLIAGGLPILDALRIVSGAVGNTIYKDAILEAAKEVESGVSLTVPLKKSGVFPAMVPQMVQVGEQTGKVDEILFKLADFFDREVDTMVKSLSTLLEPILMVVMGIGVGLLVAAIILPIYNLASAF